MQATAEAIPEIDLSRIYMEQSGLSLHAMRRVGEVAVAGAENWEDSGEVSQLKGEFESCVFEGLSSDKEFRNKLRVTKFNHVPVIDNQVMAADGKTPVINLVRAGVAKAEQDVDENPDLKLPLLTEVNRYKNDVTNAVEVDNIVAGKTDHNTRIVVTYVPKEAMLRDGVEFWEKKGYIEDGCYIQMYHYSGGDEVFTGSLSFKSYDDEKFLETMSELGIEIPDNEADDNYINYAKTATLDEDSAMQLALDMRERLDQSPADERLDTVEILDKHSNVMSSVFEQMYLPAAPDLISGIKSYSTAKVISSFLNNSEHFSSEVRRQLLKTHNSLYFDDDGGRLISQLAVYSAIEGLRATLTQKNALADMFIKIETSPGRISYQPNSDFINQMVQFAAIGASMGRIYSSCGAALEISNQVNLQNIFLGNSPQEAFAGLVCAKEVKNGDHVTCPHCSERVIAIVEKKGGKIECSNSECKMASPKVKKKLGSLSLVN